MFNQQLVKATMNAASQVFPFNVQTHILKNSARMRECVTVLIGRSQWFAVEPHCNDEWHVYTKAGELPSFSADMVTMNQGFLRLEGDRAIKSLQELRDAATALDAKIDDSEHDGDNAVPPTGDDYNELLALVAMATGVEEL